MCRLFTPQNLFSLHDNRNVNTTVDNFTALPFMAQNCWTLHLRACEPWYGTTYSADGAAIIGSDPCSRRVSLEPWRFAVLPLRIGFSLASKDKKASRHCVICVRPPAIARHPSLCWKICSWERETAGDDALLKLLFLDNIKEGKKKKKAN